MNADGYTDPFYLRFSSKKQQNLIIGSSRAAQGIQPETLKSITNKKFYNYSFSNLHSPFGETYLNAIKYKLNKRSKEQIFIICINPWTLSSICDNPENESEFRELKAELASTMFFNLKPNFFYLLKNYPKSFYQLLIKDKHMYLHKNGWLEINIEMDSTSLNNRLNDKIIMYQEHSLNFTFSSTRNNYLLNTISYLKEYGKVYLIRLPIHNKIMKIESHTFPYFEDSIKNSIEISNGYLDLTNLNSKFTYTDGNHLSEKSGEKVSKIIGNWILKSQKNEK